jgi:hypothetical protein
MNSFALKVFLAGWLTAAMSLAGSAVLGQEAKTKKPDPTSLIKFKLLAARLPADVQVKTNKLVAEHALKIAEAEAKRDAVLTPKQLQGFREAGAAGAKAAREGKSPQEIQADNEAAVKALNLTEDQKAKYAAGKKNVEAAHEDLNEALRGVLTPEQQTQVGIKK